MTPIGRPPSRPDRWRYRVFWAALGDRGREHVVRHILEQLTDREAAARQERAASHRSPTEALSDPMVSDALAQLAATDPDTARSEAARLGLEPPANDPATNPPTA